MLKTLSSIIKKCLIVIWILIFVSVGGYSLLHPGSFTAVSLKGFLEQFGGFLLIIYFILSALRGFTLVPSTPFVLVGILLFPDHLIFVYMISMAGILMSATMIYFFSREMGFEDLLKRHHSKAIEKCKDWIRRYGFLAVMVWSFLIIVPTDVICYIAGILRMRFSRFILAVAVGEGIICIILIFGGDLLIRFGVNIL